MITTIPIAIKLICNSLILSMSTMLSGRHGRIAQPDSLLDLHRHHSRYAPFLHGNADQLVRHFHRDFVVADKDKLGLARHFAHKIAKTVSIAVVERGIHLVQEAKRGWIELK